MESENPRVLIISSVDPTKGTGTVALNFYKALKAAGIAVDFMTKHPVEDYPEFISVLPSQNKLLHTPLERALAKADRESVLSGARILQKGNHAFDYPRETHPPVSPWLVTSKIQKPYNVVLIVFWYQLLSYQTVLAIYDKLHCQIHFRCPDNQPIAGGCHFIGNCERLSQGCGCCPGLQNGEPQDFTAFNVHYRAKVLEHVRPIVYGNTHMLRIHRKSTLLRDYNRLETVYPLVDNAFFHPIDKDKARQQFGIPADKKFILFFGCTILNEERKGMFYLLSALHIFYNGLSEQQRAQVLLVVAGNDAEGVVHELPFDYLYVGYVPFEQLPLIYSIANAFLCPSTDDAGPTMVNQALSCGTPVVAFNIGTALDMVLGHNTGYCAELRNAEDYATGIQHIYDCSEDAYKEMCNACRSLALERTTEEAFVNGFLTLYHKYGLMPLRFVDRLRHALVKFCERWCLVKAYTRGTLNTIFSFFGHRA